MALAEGETRALFENAPTALLLADAAGAALATNARFCRLAGVGADEAAGGGWHRALGPDDKARLLIELRAAAAGRPRALELRLAGVLVRAELAPFAGGRVLAAFTDA